LSSHSAQTPKYRPPLRTPLRSHADGIQSAPLLSRHRVGSKGDPAGGQTSYVPVGRSRSSQRRGLCRQVARTEFAARPTDVFDHLHESHASTALEHSRGRCRNPLAQVGPRQAGESSEAQSSFAASAGSGCTASDRSSSALAGSGGVETALAGVVSSGARGAARPRRRREWAAGAGGPLRLQHRRHYATAPTVVGRPCA
jgi:hypothetical protein